MATAEKQAAIAELADKFRGSSAAVLTEYRGLTVKQLTELRGTLRGHATYAVVKNTLTELAAKEAGVTAFDGQLVGPTAIAFVAGDPVEAAKGLRDFAKAQPAARHQGRRPRRQGHDRRRDHQARGPRVPRGSARQAGRRHERVADQGGLPLRRSAVAGARSIEALRAKVEAEGPQDAPAAGRRRRTRLRRTRPTKHPAEDAAAPADEPPPGRRHGWRHRLSRTAQLTQHATQARTGRNATMAKLSTDELLDAFKEMTLHRALRVREAVRGHLRGHRGGPGRRRRPGRGRCRRRRRRRPPRSRTSSTSSSRPPATRRSRSSRRSARSPASASRRPRTSSTALPSRSSRRSTRPRPTRPRSSSRPRARPSPSSDTLAPKRILRTGPVIHADGRARLSSWAAHPAPNPTHRPARL